MLVLTHNDHYLAVHYFAAIMCTRHMFAIENVLMCLLFFLFLTESSKNQLFISLAGH